MSEAFSILSGALDEAINDTKTKKLPRNVRSIEIEPAGVYTSAQVKNIREKNRFNAETVRQIYRCFYKNSRSVGSRAQ